MGRRAKALEALLGQAGVEVRGSARSFPLAELPADRLALARSIFDALGGTGFDGLRGPGAWDVTTADGLVIELDEEQHFNRYRALTLEHLAPLGLPWASVYGGYCITQEHRCGATRGWWSNPSAAKVFGDGPARWRQRAFNDACKDLNNYVRLSRVSIYDQLDGRPLGAILLTAGTSGTAWAAKVLDLVLSRASVPARG